MFGICLDFDQSNNACHLCSFDYYFNTSSNFLKSSQTFPPSYCIPKSAYIFNFTAYVNSDRNCSDLDMFCDGTKYFPLDNLFKAFDLILTKKKQYKISNIIIFLFGEKAHSLYNPSNENDSYYLFRRNYLDLTIQSLYCETENILGCLKLKEQKALILIKTDNFFFFVSNSFHFNNLKFQSNDLVLYYSNILDYQNSICSENDLVNFNNDSLLNNCYLFQKNVLLDVLNPYGFVNMEFIFDCAFCNSPQIKIENCDFLNFYSFSPKKIFTFL